MSISENQDIARLTNHAILILEGHDDEPMDYYPINH